MKRPTLFLALFSFVWLSAQDTYLHCGNIIDVESGKILSEKTIIVSADKIKSIQHGYVDGGDQDLIIDLKGKTVLPGLIDMHVHIESQSSPQSYIHRFTKNEADIAFESHQYYFW